MSPAPMSSAPTDGAEPAEASTDVALLGMFRSGTNYVRTLMERNYPCKLQNTTFGWKHGFYPSIAETAPSPYPAVPVVVVVKSPAFSLYSLHNYYRQRHKNIRASEELGAFLRERIVFFDGFNRYAPEFRFPNPVQMWNGMNWHYASIKPRGEAMTVVRYEDALADPEGTAATVAAVLGLQRTNNGEAFFVPEQRTRNMADTDRTEVRDYVTRKAFDEKEFYLRRGYLDTFTTEDREFLQREVDADLLQRLGYDEP